MKKLLYLFLSIPILLLGQEQDPCYSVNDYNILTQEANLPILLDLLSGWNIMGYSCIDEGDALELLSPISDKIILVKNNAGSVYMPEFDFNGIGNLISNQGYQIKMSETALDFEICTNPILFPQIEGCTDCEAVNFNQWATSDNGSCQFNTCTDSLADNYQGVLPCIYYGCNDPLAANYDPYANIDDGSCVVAEACPYENYLEYSPDAISYNDNLCLNVIVEGCTDNTALNYNSQATLDDESCEYIYGCTENDAYNYNAEATTDDGSCVYYGCIDPTAGNYDETANTDDGTCLIGGCMNFTAENYNPDAGVSDGSCIIYGCLLDVFPNYNSVATIGDGSCDMSSTDVFGCTDESTWNYQDFATIDNGICYYGPLPEIGDLILGGIVFYIDETGQHGLVAAMEDLVQGGTDPYGPSFTGYEWGCDGVDFNGANGIAIGTGYQNTINIVNHQGCTTENGGITAAQASLNATISGYSDWYLPSIDELQEMYNTIGNDGSEDMNEDNTGGFRNEKYWSSSLTSYAPWSIDFLYGGKYPEPNDMCWVRPIRSF